MNNNIKRMFSHPPSILTNFLKDQDPEINSILKQETIRQLENINLIASENYAPISVLEALGSPMQNKYSEGYVGARYYGGTDYIDKMESLCISRALDAFNLNSENWGVNVQALSGSPANLYVYGAVLELGDPVVALSLKDGGHLSHGFKNNDKPVSYTSKYYNFKHFESENLNTINYDSVEEIVKSHKPKLLMAGYSAFTSYLDYKKLKEICEKYNCLLAADISHISGIMSAGLCPSAFDYCDIVTSTTHKCLRGPRSALIFYNKKHEDLGKKINDSVFPGHQGGPHNHTITALAVALKLCKTEEFMNYQKQILKNAKALYNGLLSRNIGVFGGKCTENHIVMLNLKQNKIDGGRVEYLFNKLNISVNKNTLPGDKSAFTPSGIRLGTPAMTTRFCDEKDFDKIAELIKKGIDIALECKLKDHKFVDFKRYIDEIEFTNSKIVDLKQEVKSFATGKPFLYEEYLGIL